MRVFLTHVFAILSLVGLSHGTASAGITDDQVRALDRVLAEVGVLLEKYEYGQAELVQQSRGLLKSNPRQALRHIRSVDYWGGSGSVADIILYPGGPKHQQSHSDESRKDERRFLQLLIELADLVQDDGLADEAERTWMLRAKDWARIFQQWLDDGVV